MYKIIIIFALISIFTNKIKAQQLECPDFEWLSHLTATLNMGISNIKQDNLGNLYACGSYLGSATIGTFTLPPSSGTSNHAGWIAKFDSLGNCIWATYILNAYNTSIVSLSDLIIENTGNVYVVGDFRGTAVVQDDTLMSNLNSNTHGLIIKLDTIGNVIWKQVHTNLKHGNISMQSSGNIYIMSSLQDTANWGSNVLVPFGNSRLVIVNINSDGQLQWLLNPGSTGIVAHFYKVFATDIQDNLYIGGVLESGTFNFGSYTLVNTGNSEGFIAKITPQGQFDWVTKIESTSFSVIHGIVIAQSGNIFVSGNSPTRKRSCF